MASTQRDVRYGIALVLGMVLGAAIVLLVGPWQTKPATTAPSPSAADTGDAGAGADEARAQETDRAEEHRDEPAGDGDSTTTADNGNSSTDWQASMPALVRLRVLVLKREQQLDMTIREAASGTDAALLPGELVREAGSMEARDLPKAMSAISLRLGSAV